MPRTGRRLDVKGTSSEEAAAGGGGAGDVSAGPAATVSSALAAATTRFCDALAGSTATSDRLRPETVVSSLNAVSAALESAVGLAVTVPKPLDGALAATLRRAAFGDTAGASAASVATAVGAAQTAGGQIVLQIRGQAAGREWHGAVALAAVRAAARAARARAGSSRGSAAPTEVLCHPSSLAALATLLDAWATGGGRRPGRAREAAEALQDLSSWLFQVRHDCDTPPDDESAALTLTAGALPSGTVTKVSRSMFDVIITAVLHSLSGCGSCDMLPTRRRDRAAKGNACACRACLRIVAGLSRFGGCVGVRGGAGSAALAKLALLLAVATNRSWPAVLPRDAAAAHATTSPAKVARATATRGPSMAEGATTAAADVVYALARFAAAPAIGRLLRASGAVGTARLSKHVTQCARHGGGGPAPGAACGCADVLCLLSVLGEAEVPRVLAARRATGRLRLASAGGLRILCLDGGGIRGLATIEVLFALERAAGRPVADLFDVRGSPCARAHAECRCSL